MTELANPSHRERWRAQVLRIVQELKAIPDWGGKDKIKVGIVLDDAIVKVTLEVSMIAALPAETLAEGLYQAAMEMMAEEPDAAQAPGAVKSGDGREPGRPIPAPDTTPAAAMVEFSQANDPTNWDVDPAVQVVERCSRKLEPDFVQLCPIPAAGGVRLKMFPAETVQRRYGKRPLLALVLDLPICAGCAARIKPAEVIANLEEGLWATFSKEAQRRNKGFLPIKDQCEVEFVPFSDPEYVALRQQMAKAAS